MRMFPADCLVNPQMQEIRVVFPAPLGPNRANISPLFISKDILLKAFSEPKVLERLLTEIRLFIKITITITLAWVFVYIKYLSHLSLLDQDRCLFLLK